MKKTLKTLLVLLTATLLVFSLVSCGDKSAAIKKAFEKEGYEFSTVDAENPVVQMLLDEDALENVKDYELIVAKKGLDSAVIIKFPNAGAVKDYLTVEDKDGKKDTSKYDEAKEKGLINGNCIIFALTDSPKEIFKKA
ncbi:MAG: hypothetical protein IKC31_05365 [Clostridia bacterium]|nr:hypothetical protein [Clostridia bacterium]MBR2926984.1 hypothetical protein [Clostridia bacterium]